MIHARGLLMMVAAALVAAATAQATTTAVIQPAKSSVVAEARVGQIGVYRAPTALTPFRRFERTMNHGAPLVFLVKSRGDGWEQVYLPIRPNGVTGWVRDRDVDLSLNPYFVVVRLEAHTLTLFKAGRVVDRAEVGVGRGVLPTPRGVYYVTELLKQPDITGLYGPYAFGLSAHSNVLYSFGGGSGQIGIHGTNEPWALGGNVSHGCIRVANDVITRLAKLLPLGTPVLIRL
jgi:lipoprotein-anchoring transpeptidase ErfK/SrfK